MSLVIEILRGVPLRALDYSQNQPQHPIQGTTPTAEGEEVSRWLPWGGFSAATGLAPVSVFPPLSPFQGIPSPSTLLFALCKGLVCFPPCLASSLSCSVSHVFQAVPFSFLHMALSGWDYSHMPSSPSHRQAALGLKPTAAPAECPLSAPVPCQLWDESYVSQSKLRVDTDQLLTERPIKM